MAGRVGVDLPAPLRRSRTRIAAVPFGGSQAGVIIDGDLAIGVLKARDASAFLSPDPPLDLDGGRPAGRANALYLGR